MFKHLVYLVLGLAFLPGCAKDQSEEIRLLKEENAQLRAIAGPPPASLDSLYPPGAVAPLYQIRMFEMATPLTGFIMKIHEGDRGGAKVFFDEFRKNYSELSALVPEWTKDFPTGPLDELDGLIGAGEPGKVMEAVGKVDNICRDCHLTNLAKVQQQYHWQDFSAITLTDPATKASLDFKHFMLTLDMSLVGMGMELQAGNIEKARGHFDNFRNGLTELKESCQGCHDTERKYFVDADADALIARLGTALKSSKLNPALIAELSQRIGTETCGKCHMVHLPAAYARTRWSRMRQGAM